MRCFAIILIIFTFVVSSAFSQIQMSGSFKRSDLLISSGMVGFGFTLSLQNNFGVSNDFSRPIMYVPATISGCLVLTGVIDGMFDCRRKVRRISK